MRGWYLLLCDDHLKSASSSTSSLTIEPRYCFCCYFLDGWALNGLFCKGIVEPDCIHSFASWSLRFLTSCKLVSILFLNYFRDTLSASSFVFLKNLTGLLRGSYLFLALSRGLPTSYTLFLSAPRFLRCSYWRWVSLFAFLLASSAFFLYA